MFSYLSSCIAERDTSGSASCYRREGEGIRRERKGIGDCKMNQYERENEEKGSNR